tara:strand:- start:6508 stop:6717 length:210 start_codon:yes stop_codon:yes gene_type:complete
MLDIDTVQNIRHYIKKRLAETKEDIVYSIDTIEKLQYAKGKLSAYESLLQDLKDLQKREDIFNDDIDKT